MGFESLLGNARVKENLTGALRRGRISHFYLISGQTGSGKQTLARLIAAAAQCDGADKPCLQCAACRKVMGNAHPDVITVTDPEHKNVSVRRIRQARDSIFIRPNEGEKKVYIFPQEMGLEGQNALLKVLEEPPAYGVFLLLTDNPEKLLPTVRSRCTVLALDPLAEMEMLPALQKEFPQATPEDLQSAYVRSGGYLGQAKCLLAEGVNQSPQTEGFARAFGARDTQGLLQILVPMEKWKRDAFVEELQAWAGLLYRALLCRSGLPSTAETERALAASRTAREITDALLEIQKAIEYAQGNVAVAALCGHLLWTLR